jgi:peptide/nickel transport system substrate-binding protein
LGFSPFAALCEAKIVPKGKVVLVNGSPFEATGGDPHTCIGATCTQTLNTTVHEGLAKKMQDGKLLPGLAESWKFSDDSMSLRIKLNPKAVFHNGEAVTAEDVKFSYERAMRPKLKFIYGGELRRMIDKIEVLNPHELVLNFKELYPAFLDRAVHISIIPKAYTEKVGDKEFANKPVGAGPFKWVKGQQDVFYEAEAFEDHYRKVPFIKTFVYKIVQEHATRIAMLKTGEADISWIDWGSVGEVHGDSDIKLYYVKYAYVRTISFYDLLQQDKPSPWHDIRVRKALAYAIDKESICKSVLYDSSEPWGDVLAPWHPGFDPTIKPYPYDPEKAKALLKEAGYPNGFETTLSTNPNTKAETEAIAAILRNVGIIAKLNVPEEGIWTRQIKERKLHGIGSMPGPWWGGYTHPGPSMTQLLKDYPWAFVSTDEQDAAVRKLQTLMDQEQIAEQAKKLSKLYHDQMYRINLWAKHIAFGLGPKIDYWESVPGWMYPSMFEYLKLKE